ncbi:ATP-binding cassette domain-containing protein [Enterobacter asburiae]|jgi:putative thiamine transport system ATP-binding protein|uniref:Putative thiamine transport system ATP-binding protein n=1 Tax=Enterobacter asburiae TaxID=61645 RepID=A0A376F8J6_ENTAS|nr:ATP-binding cassette domain-containing protein [Enterobacter asburiae]QLO47224.1 ATP-binding cassette domain-containing protein [Enterobacter cloacae]AMA02967.1 sulfate ABC transporter ATP-binding protein [Enterobacter asburiae]ELZ5049313.1 ATP-binding cassette domain-containing protein [Enterobacter asburiae]MCM7018331.1 ATP-binding cassette domain-containing protein [Enterobacter asburiae]QLR28470.1 ATP-binding cassette domain-containing protein [Enterobacter asburiae]
MLKVNHLTIEPLFREVSFFVPRGEIVTLMGPSGSGKSTLFAWMVGALSDDFQARGELWLDARRCDGLPVESRGLGILFQDALLFEQFSVGQNLLLALPERIVGRARREAVEQALDSAGLSGHYASDPATLSGGERARVSLLRALLAEPQALLLDEPFSRLDKTLRTTFRTWVFVAVRARNIPVVLVTHDEDDIPPGGKLIEISRWQ